MAPPLTMNKMATYSIPPNRQPNNDSNHILHQVDAMPSPSSLQTPFFMPLYHSPPTSATIGIQYDNDGAIPSSTPVLSSSASTTSTTSSSSYYSTAHSSHDEEDSILPHEHFYSHLQTNTSLLRIVLGRSLPATMRADQWHRLKLEIRDEFGMTLEGQRAKASTMHLTCELLEQQTTGRNHAVYLSTGWKAGWRPLHYDAWESMEDVSQTLACSGFDRSGTGGLEFIIIRQQQQHNRKDHPDHSSISSSTTISLPADTTVPPSSVETPATQFYLRVVPTFEPQQTIHALPLVVGPFTVNPSPTTNWSEPTTTTTMVKHGSFEIEQQQQGHGGDASSPSPQLCNVNGYSQNMYRAFNLDGMNRYFMIKEGWHLGTPGKMWDSALMISDLFIQKIIQQPTCLENCHLLDLSAGTGATGLLIYFIYKHMFPEYHQNMKTTLTDLPEALPLIQYNQQINGIATTTTKDISVAPLCWGKLEDIWRIKKMAPIDIIIASDVLYEPTQFAALMKTLIHLAEPERTVIYLGYKRRGLKASDEQYFFDLCCNAFEMQEIGYNNDDDEDVVVTVENGDDKYNATGDENGSMVGGGGGDSSSSNNSNSYGILNNSNRQSGKSKRDDQVQVGWEKRYGKLVRDGTRMDGEGWLGSYAKKWQAVGTRDNNNNNNNINNGMATQGIDETGVQIYRLVRKRQSQ